MDPNIPLELPEYFTPDLDEFLKKEGLKNYKIKIEAGSGKGENFLGVIYRIIANGVNDRGKAVEMRFILKTPPQLPILREKFKVTTIYMREVFIYDVYLPQLKEFQDKFDIPKDEKFEFIRAFKTSNKDMKEYLLLDDICVQGYKMHQRRLPLPYAQVKMILKNMARYHALSFALRVVDPEKFQHFSSNLGNLDDVDFENNDEMGKMCVDKAIEALDDEMLKEKLRNFGSDFSGKFLRYYDAEPNKPYTTLVHGDCWINNLMFRLEDGKAESCRFLDWQMAREGSPVLDITYFLFNSTSYKLRKQHFNYLMDLYFNTLSKSLSYMNIKVENVYPRKAFEEQQKRLMSYGLCMSLILLRIVVGEAEDAMELEDFTSLEGIDRVRDKSFESNHTSTNYKQRLEGVLRSFVELGYI